MKGYTMYLHLFYRISNGQLVSAKCWEQDTLAESSCEVELIAANTGMHEAVWLEQFADELGLEKETTTLYCDSNSAHGLMKHAEKLRRTKLVNISDLKIREYVKAGSKARAR
ncbi:hypothetical protein PPTG_23856 [Phytophthora nicotianae INRA-310]|uniref:Uncharacterized protein n=1 Tax=Phytophthora nicotianae (strain INRA-310) TaxID=761204 RepID=W2PPI1_PHYN3|nr:hypothetical protein PPTG_23856 [Phytophthora nicotianae INRA-310]ETN02893.1 hypothetical protein PPTG_23856 [Phytophthora nicotianae INRA-310]